MHVYIGKEVHFNYAHATAFAHIATTALNVEGKSSCIVSPDLCLGNGSEKGADLSEESAIGCGIAPRRATNWRLIDFDYFIDMLESLHRFVCKRVGLRTIRML